MPISSRILLLAVVAAFWSCTVERNVTHVQLAPRELPEKSFERRPEQPFDGSSYLIHAENMGSSYDPPGEFRRLLDGQDYGFGQLSFSLSETRPGGGPPLHLHTTEEAHVLLAGTLDYIVGDQLFSAAGPAVVRIPAGIPHTFANSGSEALNLIAVFPSPELQTTTLGPNPLMRQ